MKKSVYILAFFLFVLSSLIAIDVFPDGEFHMMGEDRLGIVLLPIISLIIFIFLIYQNLKIKSINYRYSDLKKQLSEKNDSLSVDTQVIKDLCMQIVKHFDTMKLFGIQIPEDLPRVSTKMLLEMFIFLDKKASGPFASLYEIHLKEKILELLNKKPT